ncbi:XRE family transcriptional regulator [Rathayibacter sp. AY1A7]|uniref:XRE family transcriptional regulator n=1 Tax=Rathayibacter sp. AY1A7 TaxID=2080524 RepID=UPI001C68512A|nr:XRE family transcriptional regulator [Rathayibacter sp. AY1A7]
MSDELRPVSQLQGVSSSFDGSRLTLARQLAGLRKVELAKLIEMTPASVAAWENGTKFPAKTAIARLSMKLQVPPRFFAAQSATGLAPAAPHFRSLRSTTQLAQDQAFAYGRLVGDIASVIERTIEFPERNLPANPVDSGVPSSDGPERAAQALRVHFKLPVGPVQHLVRLAERAGVLVVFSAPKTASIDAFSMEASGRPLIVLNPAKDDYYRQRFDVAHELGHLMMHVDAEPGGRIAEDQAQRFASEFLMPASQIRDYLPKTTTGRGWATLRALKEHWGVSMQALLFRARTLGVMSDVTYRNAMIRISSLGWRRAEPGNVSVVEMPSLIPKAVEVLESAGVSAADLIHGPGLPLAVFDLIASRTPNQVASSQQADGESGLLSALLRSEQTSKE